MLLTAAYYLALATKGSERAHYAGLAKKAAYFALSWYYTWDVPFAPGQMLGDIGLQTRGWGNVSVENNHIDVFIFDFVDVLHWLSKEYKEDRFSTSLRLSAPPCVSCYLTKDICVGLAKRDIIRKLSNIPIGITERMARDIIMTYLLPDGQLLLCGNCSLREERKPF